MIHLKYFNHVPNVGDQFSLFLARSIFGQRLVIPHENERLTVPNAILLGSIVQWCDDFTHICGGGLISSNIKLSMLPNKVHCVRGPLTAHFLRKCGVDVPERFADPGVYAAQLFPNADVETLYRFGVVPHYVDKENAILPLWKEQGGLILDPFDPLDVFFEKLNQCEVILSSSLHGIIFAHSFGKPALWVELSSNVLGDGFKFYDYYLSLGVSPEMVEKCCVDDAPAVSDLLGKAREGDQGLLREALQESLLGLSSCLLGEG